MRAALSGSLVGFLLLAGGSPAAAQAAGDAPAPTSEDCLACHGDAALTREDGTSLAVDHETFGASIHGQLGLDCTSCHVDLANAELPHEVPLAPADCSSCHEGAVAAYRQSVHATAREAGRVAAATCASC